VSRRGGEGVKKKLHQQSKKKNSRIGKNHDLPQIAQKSRKEHPEGPESGRPWETDKPKEENSANKKKGVGKNNRKVQKMKTAITSSFHIEYTLRCKGKKGRRIGGAWQATEETKCNPGTGDKKNSTHQIKRLAAISG